MFIEEHVALTRLRKLANMDSTQILVSVTGKIQQLKKSPKISTLDRSFNVSGSWSDLDYSSEGVVGKGKTIYSLL